jgi:hypothetical protein
MQFFQPIGAEGLEPSVPWSQARCLRRWATPRISGQPLPAGRLFCRASRRVSGAASIPMLSGTDRLPENRTPVPGWKDRHPYHWTSSPNVTQADRKNGYQYPEKDSDDCDCHFVASARRFCRRIFPMVLPKRFHRSRACENRTRVFCSRGRDAWPLHQRSENV